MSIWHKSQILTSCFSSAGWFGCGADPLWTGIILWLRYSVAAKRACECFNQRIKSSEQNIYLGPVHYGGKLHVIIIVIFSLLVLLLLWTDCICECRSAKHFKMKKPGKFFESDLLTLRQSLNTASRCCFFCLFFYPNSKLKLRNWGSAGFCGTLQWVTSWLSRGASSDPGSRMQWPTIRKRPAPFSLSPRRPSVLNSPPALRCSPNS